MSSSRRSTPSWTGTAASAGCSSRCCSTTPVLLREPLLYLGLHFNEHRSDYYRLLDGVRRTGDWEAWLGFFLDGVRTTAENAVATALRAREMFADERSAIEQRGGRRAGSVLRVYDALKALPILSLSRASSETRLLLPRCERGDGTTRGVGHRAGDHRATPGPPVRPRPVSRDPDSLWIKRPAWESPSSKGWEPRRPGGCGALSPPDGGPNRWRDPVRPLSRGGRTLPAPLPGGASRRVGARGTSLHRLLNEGTER